MLLYYLIRFGSEILANKVFVFRGITIIFATALKRSENFNQ
jgi:hypothetical protein